MQTKEVPRSNSARFAGPRLLGEQNQFTNSQNKRSSASTNYAAWRNYETSEHLVQRYCTALPRLRSRVRIRERSLVLFKLWFIPNDMSANFGKKSMILVSGIFKDRVRVELAHWYLESHQINFFNFLNFFRFLEFLIPKIFENLEKSFARIFEKSENYEWKPFDSLGHASCQVSERSWWRNPKIEPFLRFFKENLSFRKISKCSVLKFFNVFFRCEGEFQRHMLVGT